MELAADLLRYTDDAEGEPRGLVDGMFRGVLIAKAAKLFLMLAAVQMTTAETDDNQFGQSTLDMLLDSGKSTENQAAEAAARSDEDALLGNATMACVVWKLLAEESDEERKLANSKRLSAGKMQQFRATYDSLKQEVAQSFRDAATVEQSLTGKLIQNIDQDQAIVALKTAAYWQSIRARWRKVSEEKPFRSGDPQHNLDAFVVLLHEFARKVDELDSSGVDADLETQAKKLVDSALRIKRLAATGRQPINEFRLEAMLIHLKSLNNLGPKLEKRYDMPFPILVLEQ